MPGHAVRRQRPDRPSRRAVDLKPAGRSSKVERWIWLWPIPNNLERLTESVAGSAGAPDLAPGRDGYVRFLLSFFLRSFLDLFFAFFWALLLAMFLDLRALCLPFFLPFFFLAVSRAPT